VLRQLWEIEEFPFHPEKLKYYETIFTIGNGYLATRGSFEEGYDDDSPATLVHGIFDHVEGMLVPELVNAPNWLPINITIDGTPFRMVNQNDWTLKPPGGAVLGYRRTLHMDHGLLRREVLFRAESGSIVRIILERFASLHDQHVLAQRVEIIPVDGTPDVIVESLIDTQVSNNGAVHWLPDARVETNDGVIGVEVKTGQSGYRLGMASQFQFHAAEEVETGKDGNNPYARVRFALVEPVVMEKYTAVYTSRDLEQPLDAACEKVLEAGRTGYAQLYNDHLAAWAACWEDSDVQIEGDESAQRAIRFTQYHILIAAPRHDDDVSIGAKTLSGLGYKGHVFWDTELFILPPLTLMQPKIARNLLMYRYHRLEGARNKAKANGYEGAMFPWESTDTGEETTPQWSDPQPDGTRIRIWTGDSEQHISTDISYAVLQYWRWTGDDEFLTKYGAEIVLDTAVFWGSRVEAKNGRYELSQQIGPDEYHENIDNSVFTNRMVVWHLEQAFKLLDWLRANASADYTRLVNDLKLTEERLAKWRDIIERMYIPFDEEKQIHIQFPGFFDMEYIPVPEYEPRTMSVQAILGHARTIQTQVIKQADVVMLMALLGDELTTDHQIKLNNWNTYFPRTDHGSSLSPAIHAWVAARLGLDETAYEMFQHAAAIDLGDNKGNIRDGIHGAASGGLWQALVFGFSGLHINEAGELATDARLPEHWRRVSFHVYYRGERRQIVVKNPVLVSPTV
jgi:trehalose/maltose hydrolase-like predicted phosphorylase